MKYLPLLTDGENQGLERQKGTETNVGGGKCSKIKGQKMGVAPRRTKGR